MNDSHAHVVRCPGTSPERGQARAYDTASGKEPWARPWPRSATGTTWRGPGGPKPARKRAMGPAAEPDPERHFRAVLRPRAPARGALR